MRAQKATVSAVLLLPLRTHNAGEMKTARAPTPPSAWRATTHLGLGVPKKKKPKYDLLELGKQMDDAIRRELFKEDKPDPGKVKRKAIVAFSMGVQVKNVVFCTAWKQAADENLAWRVMSNQRWARVRARCAHGRGAGGVRGCFPDWLVWRYPQLSKPRELDRQQAITRE
jgi:hypothetical protein